MGCASGAEVPRAGRGGEPVVSLPVGAHQVRIEGRLPETDVVCSTGEQWVGLFCRDASGSVPSDSQNDAVRPVLLPVVPSAGVREDLGGSASNDPARARMTRLATLGVRDWAVGTCWRRASA